LNFGEFAKELHQKVGEEVVKNNIDVLITIGEDSKYIAETAKALGMKDIHCCNNYEEALEVLHNVLKQGDSVLIKGSRGMKLERMVETLRREFV